MDGIDAHDLIVFLADHLAGRHAEATVEVQAPPYLLPNYANQLPRLVEALQSIAEQFEYLFTLFGMLVAFVSKEVPCSVVVRQRLLTMMPLKVDGGLIERLH